MKLKVIGAGLAGCEAAWQAANLGIDVELYEMKPKKYSPAHKNSNFAELVCSNSLRADGIYNAVGLLKEEMRRLDSFLMKCADACKVPAGGALAVDRDIFSSLATEGINSCELIEVYEEEVCEIPKDEITVVASGPLTSEPLAIIIASGVSLVESSIIYPPFNASLLEPESCGRFCLVSARAVGVVLFVIA